MTDDNSFAFSRCSRTVLNQSNFIRLFFHNFLCFSFGCCLIRKRLKERRRKEGKTNFFNKIFLEHSFNFFALNQEAMKERERNKTSELILNIQSFHIKLSLNLYKTRRSRTNKQAKKQTTTMNGKPFAFTNLSTDMIFDKDLAFFLVIQLSPYNNNIKWIKGSVSWSIFLIKSANKKNNKRSRTKIKQTFNFVAISDTLKRQKASQSLEIELTREMSAFKGG